MKDVFKEFKPSSWAINNRTSIYIITIIITLAGLMAYNALPKEQFPEITTDVDIKVAKQEVKDAVDKAQASTTFPKDLPQAPDVLDINLSDLPILYVNISGDYDLKKLKKYADDLQDRIEGLKEINRVD